jgi:hypothetical protein
MTGQRQMERDREGSKWKDIEETEGKREGEIRKGIHKEREC